MPRVARMLQFRSVLSLVAVAVLLSGCAGAGAKSVASPTISSSAAPATISDATGGIEGLVTDDEQRPIAGATIGLVELGLQAKTAADGRFSFSELEPGAYSLAAQALGYESLARKLTVVAGEVLEATFQLLPVVVVDVRQENFQYTGFLGFGVVTPVLRVPTWILCEDVGCDQDKNFFQTNGTVHVMTAVDALVWESSAPGTAKTLGIRMEFDDKDQESEGGRSPVLLRVDEPKVKEFTTHFVYTPFSSTDPEEVVQAYYQQKFEVYSSFFYGEPAPAEFTPAP